MDIRDQLIALEKGFRATRPFHRTIVNPFVLLLLTPTPIIAIIADRASTDQSNSLLKCSFDLAASKLRSDGDENVLGEMLEKYEFNLLIFSLEKEKHIGICSSVHPQ